MILVSRKKKGMRSGCTVCLPVTDDVWARSGCTVCLPVTDDVWAEGSDTL